MNISAVVITFNEERNIERCILSLRDVCEEILVADSLSTDKTKEICLNYGVKFLEHPFEGYVKQKNWALNQAKYDWILSLDADEALSEELKNSILKVKTLDNLSDSYMFNRLTNYCNLRWIKHSGWYPDRKVRLFRKDSGKWEGISLHEKFQIKEGKKLEWLKGDLLHYTCNTLAEHIEQVNKFSTIASEELFLKGKKVGIVSIYIKSSWKFIRDYFFNMGFLDGMQGYWICKIGAFSTFLKYSKLKEKNKKKEKKIG
ncbi:MAG: glycosyltransferase family 2 protein [Bacteroidales bacterium]|jgi:glycosyltransferase involved in cell wall biosynthesis|nr:glycosyltransferase family 2 protein [Bacteroidales bacterium]